ncbi:hypothetical protein AB0M43_36335 [Longispora sp. NPDC051575]|uniref:hypothetical protein n=1 Tax=Longispora sp. NPDC051575 TaxID=3154943 RepID=UPI0034383863
MTNLPVADDGQSADSVAPGSGSTGTAKMTSIDKLDLDGAGTNTIQISANDALNLDETDLA